MTAYPLVGSVPPVSLFTWQPDAEQQRNPLSEGETVCTDCGGNGGIGTICTPCGGCGMRYTRSQMAFNLISAPCREDRVGGGYTLPLIPASQTQDPRWLADLIEQATNDDGEPLTCDQLLTCFDFLTTWASSYEAGARYWRVAAERIITLIAARLRADLPTVTEGNRS